MTYIDPTVSETPKFDVASALLALRQECQDARWRKSDYLVMLRKEAEELCEDQQQTGKSAWTVSPVREIPTFDEVEGLEWRMWGGV